LFRLRVQDGRITVAERVTVDERIRDLIQMDDGTLVLWTDDRKLMELRAQPPPNGGGGNADVIGTCGTCHSFTPNVTNTAGPNLWGVFGRKMGSADYAGYSAALQGADEIWDEAKLRAFLVDPQSVVRGTTMPAPERMDEETLTSLIAVLRSLR
jgi:cytochrome c